MKNIILDEAKIQALLATNAAENQILAIQLIQSQWNWSLSEVLIYIVDFYCNTNYNEITLYLNPVKITYLLEVFDDHHFIMGWDVCLTFRIEQQQKIIKEEELVNENVKYRDSRILNDYTAKINEHFKTELPLILNL